MTLQIVAEESSFTRAARRLGITVSAVSQRVRRLEKSMRVVMLDRSTTRVGLTDAGRVLVAGVAELDAVWNDSLRRITAVDLARRTIVFGQYREVPATMRDRLEEALPEVDWVFRYFSDVTASLAALREGEVDLLSWSSWSSPRVPWQQDLSGLTSADVACERLWLYMRDGHPLAGEGAVAMHHALEYDWITPVRDQVELMSSIYVDLVGRTPRFMHDADSGEHITEILRSTDTVCTGPPALPPQKGVTHRPLVPAPRSRYAVSWRQEDGLDTIGRTVVACYQQRYAEKTREWNPGHWQYMLDHRHDYPGIQFGQLVSEPQQRREGP